ncbi:hypothetical protein BIU88_09675 [Chlorobaculum limnaeum]|uniref:Antitoxin-like ribbon-helix-helix domain-containing protein n=1 Tax=Chlorobaculum limnaeum TaxID=274537 RepID=A0A1D8D6G2_CHLLM|nr:ribbon-helix-helix domain-containing protein [Chlorobaculum limnaeum]AOS84374.1 hypothetical protein BIU88_09675 [Chlorobaculum limnaeum]
MKKSSLADALLKETKADADASSGRSSKPSPTTSYVAPSRIGKKAVTVWFEPDAVRQLKLIGLEKGVTMQEMMRESLNDFFAKNRKAEIA